MTFEPIHTDRLLLRPARPNDAEALAARRSDPEVAHLQSWTAPFPIERARELVESSASMPGPLPDEWWMLTIADPADAVVLGDLAIHPTWEGRAVEIGYSLDRTAWGKGFAVEAVGALVRRLFDDDRVTRVHAALHPANIASAQVLERTGFEYEGRTKLSYWVGDDNTDDVLYGLTRADWTAWRDRRRTPADDVALVEVHADNVRAVGRLRTHNSQERFVASVASSFGDALFPPVLDGAPAVPWVRAIEADGEIVGFVMVAFMTEHHREPTLWRLLVDRGHQRRGIGARAVDLVIDQCRSMGAGSMVVYWCEGRGTPAPLYLQHGFEPTGVVADGEIEARLDLR